MNIQEIQTANYNSQKPIQHNINKTEENDINIYDAMKSNSHHYNSSETGSFESFLKDTKYDGNDDGKLELKTELKCFGSGILDNIKGKAAQVADFAKNTLYLQLAQLL